MLSVGILTTAVFSIITPYIVEVGGATGLIILRILMGLGEGTTFPALGALIAAWVPEKERGKLGSFVFGGGQVCNVFYQFSRKLRQIHDNGHAIFVSITDWDHCFSLLYGTIFASLHVAFSILLFRRTGSHLVHFFRE